MSYLSFHRLMLAETPTVRGSAPSVAMLLKAVPRATLLAVTIDRFTSGLYGMPKTFYFFAGLLRFSSRNLKKVSNTCLACSLVAPLK